jgi:DNA-binding winged helix-turn-helix (wHTH) protein
VDAYEIGPFRVEAARRRVRRGKTLVALGPRVVETLLALAERPGEVVTKDELLERVWPEGFVEESNLAQNVYVLRKTFRTYGLPASIETVPRRGYRLLAPVRRSETHNSLPKKNHFGITPRVAVVAGVLAVAMLATLSAGRQASGRAPAGARVSDDTPPIYAIGRYYWNLRTPDGVRKSLTYFQRIINDDPQNPLGYAAMADANVTMADYCYGSHRPIVYLSRARAYARTALVLDRNSAPAFAAMGFIDLHERQRALAVSELRHAISLDPAYAPAHEWYGIALMLGGNVGDAVTQLDSAGQLDPLSVSTTVWLGSAALAQRRFADAIAYSQEALEMVPDRADTLDTIAKAYAARRERGSAQATLHRYKALLARLHHVHGHPTWASLEDAIRV